MRARPIASLLLIACALGAAGCAGSSGDGLDGRPEADARLMLAGRPAAVDAGIYLARERGYDESEGLRLQVQTPIGSLTGIRALAGGQADLAIVELQALARARARGSDLVAVQAIVQAPLHPTAGAPPAPGLVLAVTRERLETDAPVVAAAVRTLRRGYEAAIRDPESAVSALLDEAPSLSRSRVAAQLDAASPSFIGPSGRFGELDADQLAAWTRWARRVGVVHHRLDARAMYDPALWRTGERTDPD
jgi:ABC-type nitrate/sulfonate/bicarbonate transport system substrate-binding protein